MSGRFPFAWGGSISGAMVLSFAVIQKVQVRSFKFRFVFAAWGMPEENSGSRSLLLASNAFSGFAESFAENGRRPALSESTCRWIVSGQLVPGGPPSPGFEGLREGVEMIPFFWLGLFG